MPIGIITEDWVFVSSELLTFGRDTKKHLRLQVLEILAGHHEDVQIWRL